MLFVLSCSMLKFLSMTILQTVKHETSIQVWLNQNRPYLLCAIKYLLIHTQKFVSLLWHFFSDVSLMAWMEHPIPSKRLSFSLGNHNNEAGHYFWFKKKVHYNAQNNCLCKTNIATMPQKPSEVIFITVDKWNTRWHLFLHLNNLERLGFFR